MIVKISQKIALGLMITAIVPSTHAAQRLILKSAGIAVETKEQAQAIFEHPQARVIVESYKSTSELDRPTIPELVEETKKGTNLSGGEIVSNAAVSEQDVLTSGFDDKQQALVAKRSGLSTKDVEVANSMKDLYGDGDFNDDEKKNPEIIQAYHQERIGTGAVDHDALIRKIALSKLDCHNVGPRHDGAYKRLTDVSGRHVKIAKPSGIEVDTVAAWRVATGTKNPTQVQFDLIKTLLTAIYAEEPKAVLPMAEFVRSADALSAGVNLNDQNAVAELIGDAIAAAYREIVLGYAPVNLPADVQLVQTSRNVYTFLKANGFINEKVEDPLLAVEGKYVDALLEMLNPVNKVAILGAGNEPTKDDVKLFAWLRDIENAGGRVTPTLLRAVDLTRYKGIVARIQANKAKYLFDENIPYDQEDIRAIDVLDTLGMPDGQIDPEAVLAVQISTKDKKSKKNYLGSNRAATLADIVALKHFIVEGYDLKAFNHEDVAAVRYLQVVPDVHNFDTAIGVNKANPQEKFWKAVKLLQVKVGAANGVANPTPNQVKAVELLTGFENIQTAIAWRIQQEVGGGNGLYVPAGVAQVKEIDGTAHTIELTYAKLIAAAMPGGATAARYAGNKIKLVDPTAINGANLVKGDIFTFDGLVDNVAADLVDLQGEDRQ